MKQTEEFARRKIKRFSWRGEEKGLLPGGYDARSIAAEAVAEFLRDEEEKYSACKKEQGSATSCNAGVPHVGSVGVPCSRPDLIGGETPALQVRKELRRRVRLLVDRLRHRSENRLCRNEEDLGFVTTDDAVEPVGLLETIAAPANTPLEILIPKEEAAERDARKEQFVSFLGQDALLQGFFACLCDGITHRAAIAAKLGITPKMVKNAQRRFARRVTEFQQRGID